MKVLKFIGDSARRVLQGGIGGPVKVVTGAYKGVKEEFQSNKDSDHGGKGSQDWLRTAAFVVSIGLIILYLLGYIDKGTFLSLIESIQGS